MLRVLSALLLFNTVLWIQVVRWRRLHRPERTWKRWVVVWGLLVLGGWISVAVNALLMLRGAR